MIDKKTNSFYVYGLFEEDVCFYIGKGKNSRYKQHFKQYKQNYKMCNYMLWCKLKSLEKRNVEPVAVILKDNLTEDEAYELEKYYISIYKKKIAGGTLCNITDGGNHPPSLITIRETRSIEEYEKVIAKQQKTFKRTITERNRDKIEQAAKLMAEGNMLKDIAAELKVSAKTIRTWLRQAGIPINYEGKNKAIKFHLEKLSKNRHNNKLPDSAKTYKVLTPDKKIITTQRLIIFCKENGLDYSNLRQTYNGKSKQHKGYSLIEVLEPVK